MARVTSGAATRSASGGPASANVTIGDNFFNPSTVTIGPGGSVTWKNTGANDHIAFAPGGGAAQYCLRRDGFT